MISMIVKTFCLLLILGTAVMPAGLAVAGKGPEPIAPRLTPKLHGLLRAEMASVSQASQEILVALVAGEDQRVAELAQRIHDSFILRQSMTEEDKQHLMSVAPEEFVNMDRNFHAMSAELAQAARDGDRALQRQKFGQMLATCSACHGKFATDRFPGFAD